MTSLFISNLDNVVKEVYKYFNKLNDIKYNDIYQKNKINYKNIFISKKYDNIFYFSKDFDDFNDLNNFLKILDNTDGVKKYIYVVRSDKFSIDNKNEKIGIIQEIFNVYSKIKNKKIIFLNVSCLYGKDFIEGKINNLQINQNYNNEYANYVHIDDFCHFLFLVAKHVMKKNYLELKNNKSIVISSLISGGSIIETFEYTDPFEFDYHQNHSFKEDILKELDVKHLIRQNKVEKKGDFVIKIFEIILMFFVAEFFINIFNNRFNLQYVDFRLIYIVMIAIYYDWRYSLISTFLVIMSFLYSNIKTSYDIAVILSNTDNWIAIIIYLIISIIISNRISKFENYIKSIKEKINVLEQQNEFNEINIKEYKNKIKELNKNLIIHDSSISKVDAFINKFGKLNTKNIYKMFSENLGTNNIVIFETINDNLENAYTNSKVNYYNFSNKRVSEFFKKNKIWVNGNLEFDLPLFIVPIFNKKEISYVVAIWDYEISIFNTDYKNTLISLSNIASFLEECEN